MDKMLENWKCISDDQVWVTDNFLSNDQIDFILDSWNKSAEYQEVHQKGMKYLVTPTNYHYQGVNNTILEYNKIQDLILTQINLFYSDVFKKTAPTTNLSYLQYFMKTAVPNVSFYDLHCEPSVEETEHFGDAVFMLYLSDETDGEIIFPNEQDAQQYITPAYQETCRLINVNYVKETVSITPKKNKCVVLRTGVPHYVNKCSGYRYCIQGMSFASDDYRSRWKQLK
jgi:hypothetical protein